MKTLQTAVIACILGLAAPAAAQFGDGWFTGGFGGEVFGKGLDGPGGEVPESKTRSGRVLSDADCTTKRYKKMPAEMLYALGRHHARAGRVAETKDAYRCAAAKGYVKAQLGLAEMYLDTDDDNAVDVLELGKWLGAAARSGNIQGQYLLGRLYMKTDSGIKPADAALWLEKAAEQGHADAQFRLGRIYEFGGRGIAPDASKSKEWYRRAADRGHEEAQRRLDAAQEIPRFREAMPRVIADAASGDASKSAFACKRFSPQLVDLCFFQLATIYGNDTSAPHDPVAAYALYSMAGEHTTDRQIARNASSMRVRISVELTPEQRLEAQRLVQSWRVMWNRQARR